MRQGTRNGHRAATGALILGFLLTSPHLTVAVPSAPNLTAQHSEETARLSKDLAAAKSLITNLQKAFTVLKQAHPVPSSPPCSPFAQPASDLLSCPYSTSLPVLQPMTNLMAVYAPLPASDPASLLPWIPWGRTQAVASYKEGEDTDETQGPV